MIEKDIEIKEVEDLLSTLATRESKRDYKREIMKFIDCLDCEFWEVNPEKCRYYISELKERTYLDENDENHLAMSTVSKKYKIMYRFYSFLESQNKIVSDNPFKQVKSPKTKEYVDTNHIMSTKDLDKLITALKSEKLRDYAGIMLQVTSGLYPHQLVELKISQFVQDSNGNIGISIVHKDKVTEFVKVNKDVWPLVESLIKENGGISEYLFLNRFKNPLSSRWLRKVLGDVCIKAGLNHRYTLMDLRHTLVVKAKESGASEEQLSSQFHWRKSKVALKRYNYVIPSLENSAVDFLKIKLDTDGEETE